MSIGLNIEGDWLSATFTTVSSVMGLGSVLQEKIKSTTRKAAKKVLTTFIFTRIIRYKANKYTDYCRVVVLVDCRILRINQKSNIWSLNEKSNNCRGDRSHRKAP